MTNVKFGPPVIRDELCVQAGLDKVADQLNGTYPERGKWKDAGNSWGEMAKWVWAEA